MKILLASSIDTEAIEALRSEHDVKVAFNAGEAELRHQIRDREILIFRSGVQITAGVMAAAPGLRLLIRAGSGLDNIDMAYVDERGLKLVRIPEPGARAVAEMTFGLMLGICRKIVQAHQLWSGGRWVKKAMQGHLLRDKVLGIIGLGSIGTQVAKLGGAWGMRPIGCVKHPSPGRAAEFSKDGIELLSFDQVIESADIVSVHVPLNEETHHMIGANELARMRHGAFLINIARGGVVDELALREALEPDGHIRGAAVDVHENEGDGNISPLAGLANVILTPHIGAMAVEAQQEIGRRILQIVSDFAPRDEAMANAAAFA